MDHLGSMLLGLGNGGVFAALALALVLTYRSSGVINFATGAMALYGAYTYASLREGELLLLVPGLPGSIDLGGPMAFVPAALIAIAVNARARRAAVRRRVPTAADRAAAGAGRGVARRPRDHPGADGPAAGDQPGERGADLPGRHAGRSGRSRSCRTASTSPSPWSGSTLVLAAVFRFTRFGLLTRATADSQEGAFVSGVSPDRVALLNWMISAGGGRRGRHPDRPDQPADARSRTRSSSCPPWPPHWSAGSPACC